MYNHKKSVLFVFFAAFLAGLYSISAVAAEGDPVAGKRLYMDGITASGAPVTGTTQGDIKFSGSQMSCVSCHRPSGYGSSEGGSYVPPIRATFLFNPTSGDRNRIFKELYTEDQPPEFWAHMRNAHLRPGYTNETLARALREGVDPTGKPFGPVMPRYEISDEDANNLAAYLRTLKTTPDPGVKETEVHFATIVTENADPAAAKAVVDTINAYFEWINKDTEGDRHNPSFSPYYRSDFMNSYRYWRLHVWTLKGAPESWPEQLDRYYAETPVFAVVSGLVKGPFAPIADFCDRTHTPCVFPNTELPRESAGPRSYSLYFSAGRELEGSAAAAYAKTLKKNQRIVQFYLDDNLGRSSAEAFSKAFKGASNAPVSNGYASARELEAALSEDGGAKKADVLVVWPGAETTAVTQALGKLNLNRVQNIILPSDAVEPARAALPKAAARKAVFSFPYEVPSAYHPRAYRIRAWMRARGLSIDFPRLQFQTYYAVSIIEYTMAHLLSDYNRDYLIELIEHEAENELDTGTHPTLALGPGQRFASKGVYMVRLAETGGVPTIEAVSPWIVP